MPRLGSPLTTQHHYHCLRSIFPRGNQTKDMCMYGMRSGREEKKNPIESRYNA